jgi:hypothetical protein
MRFLIFWNVYLCSHVRQDLAECAGLFEMLSLIREELFPLHVHTGFLFLHNIGGFLQGGGFSLLTPFPNSDFLLPGSLGNNGNLADQEVTT